MSSPRPSSDVALIARAVLQLGRRLRAARPAGAVGLSALGMLTTLARSGPMPAARLAEAERLKPQSLSRIIVRLEAQGLIERRPGVADRRTLVLALTPQGEAAVRHDLDSRRAWLEMALATTLTPQERRRLASAAWLMLKLADDAPAPAADDED